ncbi:hypothetical protein L4D09_23490 [Photobacterium makurazakiensis]|uniref:hypothetical protein n=1 Tax=Photobacterium TaxID=657 RepID=UPI003D0ABD30
MTIPLKVGKETLLNINSIEYQWIRSLASEGNSVSQINTVIQRCLGGSSATADMLRQVALKQQPINQLLRSLRTLA